MSKNETKIALKEILVSLIAKGTVALAKLIKSKLLPKAEEKYCKVLQAVTEKITNRTAERIAELLKETDIKKRVRYLYLLKLVRETLDAVSVSLAQTVDYIKEHVDFNEIEEPTEEALVALADIPGALDNDGGCGPDGCEIA